MPTSRTKAEYYGPRPNLKREVIKIFPKNLIKSLDILTLDSVEDINRYVALVEAANGKTATVFIYSDEPPSRVGEEFIYPSIQNYTHVGQIDAPKEFIYFDNADKKTRSMVKKISSANEMIGIRSDKNFLVGSMAALVVPDQENLSNINDAQLQRAIGSLFGPDGFFNNYSFLSNMGSKQTDNFTEGGARLLLNQEQLNIVAYEAVTFIGKLIAKGVNDIRPFLIAVSAYLKQDLTIPKAFDSSRGLRSDEELLENNTKMYFERVASAMP